jgi:aminoglycoside phosphotransferase (APT) family kinase protein
MREPRGRRPPDHDPVHPELATYAVPPSLVHGDLHLGNVALGPRGHLFFDWTDAGVAHPFLDLLTFVADLQPVERHTARSPAYWLRKVLAGLRASSV